MEHALATHYPALINAELARRGRPPLDLGRATNDAERLKSTATQMVASQVFARDLVLTGSRLKSGDEPAGGMPSDLYFYLHGRSGNAAQAEPADPPFGARGIALAGWPELTLDVVLGSGSIFPVFPARKLHDFPVAGVTTELVDGGFAHNSPVEAAALWGATHVVLVEASPQERVERTNFVTNAAASFGHLYEQSQLLDARARGKVAIFALAPEAPHLCVLDFADNLIEDSIDRGYRDALGVNDSSVERSVAARPRGRGRFGKELGEPVFVALEALDAPVSGSQ
jgi:hypothetical protein